MLTAMSIVVGQVYASTHSGDVAKGERQRRRVVAVNMAACKVQLVTEYGPVHLTARPSTVTLRSPRSRTIPGHRLVEDVLPDDAIHAAKDGVLLCEQAWTDRRVVALVDYPTSDIGGSYCWTCLAEANRLRAAEGARPC